jgi:myosin heavy subunit
MTSIFPTDISYFVRLFLISVNPYQQLPLYTPQIVASYRNKRRDECHPHIFATAERAWVQMIEESACQSVLITLVPEARLLETEACY